MLRTANTAKLSDADTGTQRRMHCEKRRQPCLLHVSSGPSLSSGQAELSYALQARASARQHVLSKRRKSQCQMIRNPQPKDERREEKTKRN